MRWNVALAGLAASWGLIAVIVSAVDLDATVLVFFRLALAAVTMAVALAVTGKLALARPVGRVAGLVGLGVVLAVHWFLYFETIKLSSVAVAVLTVYTAPVFIAIAAPVFLPEGRSTIGLVALAPAVVGIVLIALSGDDGGAVEPLALVTGVGAGVTYAMLVIGAKRLRPVAPAVTLHIWSVTVAAVALAPFLVTAPEVLPDTGEEVAALLVLGVVFTGLTGFLYLTLLGHVTAQAAGVLAFIEPVSASLLAWALLDQPLTTSMLIGGALILVAGIIVVVREPPDAAAIEVPPSPRPTAE